jgi:hypothetical protein
MSGFNGRRAPNFAQYLEDLNAIPSPYEQSSHQQDDAFNLEAELAMFTNTEFLEFDHFPIIDMPLPSDTLPSENTSHESGLSNPDLGTDYLNIFNDDLNLPDLLPNGFNMNTAQTNLDSTSSFETEAKLTQVPAQQVDSGAGQSPDSPMEQNQSAGPKRKAVPDVKSLDEDARLAAEEDKRRRNTAASARFRVKKKQREQTLERTVKEATEKNAVLEARVNQLELENQWLKNLITEKKGLENSKEQRNEKDIAQMFKKFLETHRSNQRSANLPRSSFGSSSS